jgi:cobalt-zinc-cadmium resistance protein CzcA
VLGTAGLALAASLVALPRVGTEFLPELNEGAIWINCALEASVSISEAQSVARRLRAAAMAIPEVRTAYSELGRPEDGTDPKIVNQVEVLVDLHPEELWKRPVTKAQIVAELDYAVQSIPGLQVSFSQPIRDNVLESISQVDGQIVIKIVGDDLDRLREYGLWVTSSKSSRPRWVVATRRRSGRASGASPWRCVWRNPRARWIALVRFPWSPRAVRMFLSRNW